MVSVGQYTSSYTPQAFPTSKGPPVQRPQAAPHRLEGRPQLAHALPDEFHAAVVAGRKGVQDLAVEDERAVHGGMRGERRMQCSMIVGAQVAAAPQEAGSIAQKGI